MDELIQAMSIAELENFKTTYKDNGSITKIVDGYIEVKARQEAQARAKEDFSKAIGKLVAKLPHPDDVHNIYLAWREVEVEDTTHEGEEVELVVTPAVVNDEGNITTPAVMGKERRYPKVMVYQWVVELNKGFSVGKASQVTTSKRAITLNKRNGQALEFIGNFLSASKACESLKIPIGGDSATRVLNREGYILDAYTGTDFTN